MMHFLIPDRDYYCERHPWFAEIKLTKRNYTEGRVLGRHVYMLADSSAFITFMAIIFPVVTSLTSSLQYPIIQAVDIHITGRNFHPCSISGMSLTKS